MKYCYTKLKCLKHKLSFFGINKDKTLKTTNNIIRENFQYNEFRMSPENTNLKTKLLFSVSFFVTFCLFCTNNKEMKHFNNNCKWQWKNESFLASTSIAKCWLQTLDRAENFGLKIGVH